MLEEHPRQRLVFQDRHLMLVRDFPDALRVQADALGHDFRGAHGFAVVTQRDGDVRGVGDDDIGLGHFGQRLGLAEVRRFRGARP